MNHVVSMLQLSVFDKKYSISVIHTILQIRTIKTQKEITKRLTKLVRTPAYYTINSIEHNLHPNYHPDH